MNNKKVPVLFLIFNRPDVAVEAFKAIRDYHPDRLYIAADGPRAGKPGEPEKCGQTRRAVLAMVDWPCEVKTLFRNENLGCAHAVYGGITWFFQHEEFGVIIEDDVVVAPDFYHLCEELGQRYRNEEKVMMINAIYLGKKPYVKASYGFSRQAQVWGWATWRRAWQHMDMSMSRFPAYGLWTYVKEYGLFKGLMQRYYYWGIWYKKISSGGEVSSWATRWAFSLFAARSLVITPQVNLVKNIGCTGTEGTHYSVDDVDPYSHLAIGRIEWPLTHPEELREDRVFKRIETRDFYRIRMIGLMKKMRKLVKYGH